MLELARGVEVGHADGPFAARCHVDLGDEAPRSQLGSVEQGMVEEGHGGVAARVDGAHEPRAEATRVAGRPPVVGPGCDGHRERIRLVAETGCPLGEQPARVHRRVGRQRELAGARSLGECRRRHLGDVALHAEVQLDLVVVRRQVVVGERPVGDVGAGHRPIQRKAFEVVTPEPRRLGVPVDRPPADGRGEVVDVADEGAIDALARLLLGARRAGLEHRVLVLEGPAGLDLVVAEGDARACGCSQAGQQVTALLEDQDRVAGLAQRPGGRAGTCPGAHDDHRLLGHS